MLFNSFQFLIFYVVVLAVFFRLPVRHRWAFLLAASYLFYASWRAEYLLLIVASTLINYGVGLGLERWADRRTRRLLLAAGVTSSLSILFVYKYLDFALSSAGSLLGLLGVELAPPRYDFILPLGISFYTFQAVGYAIDVHRGATPAERHLGIFALYVSFFPQLVAGPIERSHQLLPQLRRPTRLEPQRVVSGLQLALWGLFKKVVIADSISTAVDHVYADPGTFSGPYLALATVFFSVQIYCDFSGYSDIAIGTARIMGYDLMTNFRRPYFARSIAEFWRRWHISLSTWFRDYLYVPLGGNRVVRRRWMTNIMIVFVVSGVWHGANWTFVVWGAIHGACMVLASLSQPLRRRLAAVSGLERVPRLHTALQISIVVAISVTAWVFFRAESVDDALSVLMGMLDWRGARLSTLWALGLPRFEMMVALASIVLLFLIEGLQEWMPPLAARVWARRRYRWACYAALFYGIVFFGVFGQIEFIYFQF